MSEIFIQCALTTMFREDDEDWQFHASYRWLAVTRVCHSWRETALNCPSLWSYALLIDSPRHMCGIIARAKQATLSLECDRERRISSHHTLNIVAENLARVRVLDLSLYDNNPRPRVESPPVASQLTYFALRYDPETQKHCPILFEQCDMPKLLHLELHEVSVSWTSPVFRPSLTRLVISASSRRTGTHSSIPQSATTAHTSLIEALGSMPLLRHLDLTNSSTILQISASENDILHLPHLRVLKLRDHTQYCTSFLDHVEHPATTCISLDPTFGKNATKDVTALRSAIMAKLKRARDPNPDRMHITSVAFINTRMYRHAEVVGWTTDITFEEFTNESTGVHNSSAVPFRISYRDPMSLSTVWKLYPLRNVTKLYFATEMAELKEWLSIAKFLPNVEHLAVRPQTDKMSVLLRLLSAQCPSAPPETARIPIFPKLKVLMLYAVAFRLWKNTWAGTAVADAYCKMLAGRRDVGSVLDELELQWSTNLLPTDVEKLETMVGKVTWDPEKTWTTPPFEAQDSDLDDEV